MSATIRPPKRSVPKGRRCEKLADILKRIRVPENAGPQAKRSVAKVQELLRRADEATELAIGELVACVECSVPAARRSRMRVPLRQFSQCTHDLMDLRENAAYLIGRAIAGREQ